MTETAKLTPSDAALDDNFGFSIAISGNTVVVGRPDQFGAQRTPGVAYVFTESGRSGQA